MLAHSIKREYQKLGRKLAALRPQLLTTEEEAQAELPRKRIRSNALSAAEARRRHTSALEEGAGAGTSLPVPDESSRAKPTA
jgi:uncharacterized membrane-anchored protein YhcB (DUF1043 family)